MNGSPEEPLAIIVAMTEPAMPDFASKLTRFSEEAGPLGEVYVIDSSGGLSVEWLARKYPNVRVLYRPIGQLAPQLWRDGLVRSETPLVAFTTSQMMICKGWRAALVNRLQETNASGVGGPITTAPKLSRIDRAVALLRYSTYFPPLSVGKEPEPPGDNSLYRRDRLDEVEQSWADGFWEVEVHQALRQRGITLAMAGSAVATFDGGSRWRVIAGQRTRHARRYGAIRSKSLNPFTRFLKVMASPLVPPLLCLRILWRLRSKKMGLFPWISAGPDVMLLASFWAFGEALGTWQGSPVVPDNSRHD
jgi:hypothetical protein